MLAWYDDHSRDLPWRGEKDPYKIWLSEIILQQTRIEQGLSYYNNFVNTYPTVYVLANASEDEVLKLWEGLGYYSRGRNLLFTAKDIVSNYDGKFPDNAKELSNLKGIGSYTSAAISSIVNGEKIAAVDGNAFRVLARYYNIDKDIAQNSTRKYFEELMTELIEGDRPGDFNQSIMDLGSAVCKPKRYNCEECPLNESCESFAKNIVDSRPVKIKRIKIKDRYLNFIVLREGNSILVERRNSGIWKGLYQFPMIESNKIIESENELESLTNFNLSNVKLLEQHSKAHKLSHQNLFISYWEVKSRDLKVNVNLNDIENYSFPKPLKEFLEHNILEVNI